MNRHPPNCTVRVTHLPTGRSVKEGRWLAYEIVDDAGKVIITDVVDVDAGHAALIAAAPDLLAALKTLRNACPLGTTKVAKAIDLANAAIAKAEPLPAEPVEA